MKNGSRFIIPVPRWQSVGVQMFMNMNSEWMASFPNRNNCYLLFWFPCGVVRHKENNPFWHKLYKVVFFFVCIWNSMVSCLIVEILHHHFCTPGGGAGVRLWDRAAIRGHMGEQLRCQVQRNNSKITSAALDSSFYYQYTLISYCSCCSYFKSLFSEFTFWGRSE